MTKMSENEVENAMAQRLTKVNRLQTENKRKTTKKWEK
jgi:hypothetical protein